MANIVLDTGLGKQRIIQPSRNSQHGGERGATEQHTTGKVNRKEGALSFAWEKWGRLL